MKVLRFIISIVLSAAFIWFLDHPLQIGEQSTPPLGQFFSPFHGFWQNAESATEMADINIKSEEILNPVDIVFDERLVPHIFATNKADAYFTMGYLHAKFRLFQMDLQSRSAAGTLAEVLGPKLLKRDKSQRRYGLSWGAEKAVESWKESDAFPLLEKYSAGYNEYLKQLSPKDFPIEFKLLDYEPQPWSPYRTALLWKSMAQTLCSRNDDIKATNTLDWLGKDQYYELFPEEMKGEDPVIPSTVEYPFNAFLPNTFDPESIQEIIGHIPTENPEKGIGSNNWAVSGNKSKSGYPILSNDPHLSLTLPSIWYEAHMVIPETNVYGVSLCGLPGIIIGFNENIAWGFTNVGHDLMDWYVDIRIETINVKGQAPVIDSVKYTHWGPVYYESGEQGQKDLAVRWVANEKPRSEEIEALLRMNEARNFDEYTQAAQCYQTPPQNFAFISKSGDIGLRVQGRFPKKKFPSGNFVNDGSTTEGNWTEFISKNQTPVVLNPKREFISSANQKSTAKNYPYYYNGSFEEYRGRWLNQKLTNLNQATKEDFLSLQNDNYNLKAAEFTPLLLSYINLKELSGNALKIVKELQTWNFEYLSNSTTPPLFESWLRKVRKLTWDEFIQKGESTQVIYPSSSTLRDFLREKPSHVFFDRIDTDLKETAHEIVQMAFEQLVTELEESGNQNFGTWRSFDIGSINHLARIPAFGVTNIQANGSRNSLNAFSGSFGPSWRMIVEMGERPTALGVYPGGQSGNPGSKYYDSGIEYWRMGKLYELKFISNIESLADPVLTMSIAN